MATKGYIPWNKGKKLNYCSRSMLGKKHSEKTKKRISKALTGNKNSLGARPNKGSFKKGDIPWNKGKTGYSTSRKGQAHTKKTRKKISETKKGCIAWNRGIPLFGEALERWKKTASLGRQKQQVMKGPTSIEKKVYDELRARGLLFEKQKLINGKFVVDAYIPSLNLVIEADGDYWHSLDRVRKRDRAKNAYLTKCGFSLLRITETEINNGKFKKKIEESI